ncbi:Nitrogen permease regulator 2 [Podila humilis]|nr:Nitrogen permease regulator 2 [Podila humilis]
MGFPRLLSIFYCTFHPIQGPKVLYEVPEGSILSKTSPLVDFDSISEYLIPKVELCSKLVTISTPTCKVIGYPINLLHKKFHRNALMFNLVFVFDKDAEISSYEPVVRKMARVLKDLEKESEFLSRQTRFTKMDNGTTLTSLPLSSTSSSSSSPATTYTATTNTTTAGVTPTATTPAANTTSPATELAPATNNTAAALATGVVGSSTVTAPTESVSSDTNTAVATTANSISNISLVEPTSSTPGSSSIGVIPAVSPDATTTVIPSTVAIPTSIPPGPPITSTAIVSSPPTLSSSSSNTAGSVLMAPPSSSPFPSSTKPTTTATAVTGNTSTTTSTSTALTNPPTRLPPSPSLLQQNQIEHGSGMQNLIEQLIEDLNSYCECQIPIDSANTINLKLFPTYPNPAPVYDYQVPISTVNLEALIDVNWDMTMQRITGYINGVNSVKRIAEYADVETGLARMCMEHLLYYGCIIMVDLFQFKNIYAVKMEMMRLTEDTALQYECVSYVTLPDMHAPSFAKVFALYCSLQYGVVLQDWIETNQISEYNIDVRRFISFGVIKGFLYRVHKYPILDNYEPVVTAPIPSLNNSSKGDHQQQPQQQQQQTTANSSNSNTNSNSSSSTATPTIPATSTLNSNTLNPNATKTAAATTRTAANAQSSVSANDDSSRPRRVYGNSLAPTDQTHPGTSATSTTAHSQQSSSDSSHSGKSSSGVVIPPALRKLLDGQHHYDELCTQFGCSVRDMDQILATDSRVKFIYR